MAADSGPVTRRRHATKAPKSERLEVRATADQKRLLQEAADLQGQSLSSFVVGSAQQAAERVIRSRDVIKLSARDSRTFVEALLNPEPAGPRLRRAAEQYKAFMSDQ